MSNIDAKTGSVEEQLARIRQKIQDFSDHVARQKDDGTGQDKNADYTAAETDHETTPNGKREDDNDECQMHDSVQARGGRESLDGAEADGEEAAVGIRFKPYSSIENSSRTKFLDEIADAGLAGTDKEWVCTEKVHGANFSFCTDGKTIECYKRTGPVMKNFFGHEEVLKNYAEKVIKLFHMVSARQAERARQVAAQDGTDIDQINGAVPMSAKRKQKWSTVHTVTIFGEIFGGSYEHPDVPRHRRAVCVQKHVNYCPHNDFYGFDISINRYGYLNIDEANELFEQCGFYYAKPLFRGTLQQCLEFDTETFETAIPALFGLPPLKNNLAEGVVIRPVLGPVVTFNLKKKHSLFAETINGSKKPAKLRPKSDNPKKDHRTGPSEKNQIENEEVAFLRDEAMSHVTENRVRNMVSKIGEIKRYEFQKLVGMTVGDVHAELKKDHQELMQRLKKDHGKEYEKFEREVKIAVAEAAQRVLEEMGLDVRRRPV